MDWRGWSVSHIFMFWMLLSLAISEPGGRKEMSSILADQQRPRLWAQMGSEEWVQLYTWSPNNLRRSYLLYLRFFVYFFGRGGEEKWGLLCSKTQMCFSFSHFRSWILCLIYGSAYVYSILYLLIWVKCTMMPPPPPVSLLHFWPHWSLCFAW